MIFYNILIEEIQLEPDASKYFFINQGMLTIDRLDDAQEMRDTKIAFDTLMFTQKQQIDLFKITSAIANWGNFFIYLVKYRTPRIISSESLYSEQIGREKLSSL